MKKLILICIFLLVIKPVYGDIDLSEEEESWLKVHQTITYAGDPLWPPIDFNDQGKHSGLVIDYIDLLEEVLDIKVDRIYYDSWDETVNALKLQEVDMIAASYHEDRAHHMHFSESFIDIPYIIIAREDFDKTISYNNLAKFRVATIEGWLLNQVLEENHPGIDLIVYKSVTEALRAISFGNADCMIQDVASASYAIQTEKITGLKNAGSYPDYIDVRFAIRKDYDIFVGIVNKVLLDISKDDQESIYNHWITLETIPFYKTLAFLNLVLLSLFIIILSLLWIFTLRKQVKFKTKALREELERSEKIQLKLEDNMANLMEIQQEIIRQERLASLGSMVAGISHEVNNPLGVALTTSTAFAESTKRLSESLSNETLTKSGLNDYLQVSSEMSEMLTDNISNAIEIINNLRSVAINQENTRKEDVNIKDYLIKIKDNLKYELRMKSIEVKVVCQEDINISLYVGAFTQIITNLMLNSLNHAFKGRKDNLITISVMIEHEELVIEHRDNGRGIDIDNRPFIFDMFFTTRKDEGGSGLGLHIVKTLLKDRFNGRITYSNNGGAVFRIFIPLQ